jgi:hypothetical protein
MKWVEVATEAEDIRRVLAELSEEEDGPYSRLPHTRSSPPTIPRDASTHSAPFPRVPAARQGEDTLGEAGRK